MQYKFLQEALWVSMVLGIGCGIVGCFIILRGLSLMGDAISHAVIPGVAISYMLNINYFIGAVIFGIMAALGMGFIKENSKIKSDTSIGIVFSAFLALGILLITKIQSSIDLNNILFGNVLTIKNEERTLTYLAIAGVLLTIFLFYKELLLTTFDPVMAKASGMKVKLINYILMTILTVITVVSLQTVGAILVVAMLITPASTAYLLTNNFKTMLLLSALLGAISSVIGLVVSVSYNLPSGVVIVLTSAVLFLIAFILSPRDGLIINYLKTKKL
ncbi:MAG: metal ABC transporter permease [Chitinophagales bacterium]|nr:metal ABC transporter permease [Chitinophagales bacterium]